MLKLKIQIMKRKVKVKNVYETAPKLADRTVNPIIVQFEHGKINDQVNLGDRLIAGLYESNSVAHNNPQNTKKRLVIIQGEKDMTYLGSSEGSLNTSTQGQGIREFIAVRHNNKLRVYEANSITVSPYIANRAHLKVEDHSGERTKEENKAAAQGLVKEFGSKKKRLAFERKEKNLIDSAHMNESINTATEKVELSEQVEITKDISVETLIPPCNRETTDIKSVYSVYDILPEDILDDMNELAHSWLNSTSQEIQAWKESKQYSEYFFEMWRKLSVRKDERNGYLAKLVLYTELLIYTMKMKHTEIKKKFPIFPDLFPSFLVEKALKDFTHLNAKNLRCRPEEYKDKTCCYIMVLVLLVNDFLFDVKIMSLSLQIHINKLLTLARAVGITINYNAATKEYRGLLKFPLPKPIEKRGRRKALR